MYTKLFLRLTFSVVIFPVLVNAQWTTNGTSIYNTNTGNVGIGTNTPISKLTVQSNELQLQLTGASDTNKRLRLGYNTLGNYGSIQALRYGSTYDNFVINGEGGNVGIGTASPLSKLHVNSELSGISAISIGAPNSPGNVNVPLGGSPGGYNIDFYGWRDILYDQIGARIRAERINIYQNNNALVQGVDLAFFTSPGILPSDLTEKMRISNNGNVGIGTSVPDAKLTVAGNIHAREVKVSVNAGADFVFDDNYKPFTLDETEQFVKTNKHLPDIAPESEMLKEGINLSEMNIKLLQKIEELTLHLIELKKENNENKLQLLTQQQDIENLKSNKK